MHKVSLKFLKHFKLNNIIITAFAVETLNFSHQGSTIDRMFFF